jgi:ABC-2 type transport system permease protein
VADTSTVATGQPAPSVARAYGALVRSRVAAQTAYRASFGFELSGQFLIGVFEFTEIYVIFHQVKEFGGFSFGEVTLMFGLATCAFALADIAVGHIESLPTYVRTGQFDAMLLRPLSALGQMLTSDFSLRRVGRCAFGLVVLVAAVVNAHLDWTPARAALLAITPLAGGAIFAAVFVTTATASFWLVEGTEFANAFTYGGNYLASMPFTIFDRLVRTFFTFVVPAAFVAYLPALALLGREDPLGMPAWLSWSGPLVALLSVAVSLLVWRVGLRHYTGAGS